MRSIVSLVAILVSLNLAIALTTDPLVVEEYETIYINQSLTHEPNDDRTFEQRYLINDTFWEPRGPIFFYTGNEGPIEAFWEGNGFLRSLAPKFGALVLFGESRYYGRSVPLLGTGTGKPYEFLTTELILADYASVLRRYAYAGDRQEGRTNSPVISFGGSYGGTLTTFLRASYPELVTGAIAASAPIGYYDPDRWSEFTVSSYTFSEIVAENYGECLDSLHAAMDEIRATDINTLISVFDVCSPEALYGNATDGDLAALFQYALESLPQQNYPYPVGNIPGQPVDAVCAMFSSKSDLDRVEAAATATRMVFGNEVGCLEPFSEGVGGVPGDGPGLGPWGYQSCTETLHLFSSVSLLRNYTFNITAQNDICQGLYGVTPNRSKLTSVYGGYNLPHTLSNVFWSNGELDPWHGGGFLPRYFETVGDDTNHFCLMPNGAHHIDLRLPVIGDPPDVQACRASQEEAISLWLSSYDSEEHVSTSWISTMAWFALSFCIVTLAFGAIQYVVPWINRCRTSVEVDKVELTNELSSPLLEGVAA
eukprot:CAMPEP_0194378760 /NCGR_PEP_ID=MMETSP0174-20130528/37061_1 /TAXON_ID=216777 /ORGANISM="Proboscia alata, Strain PI-D3" /LENGTH=536 /DNA_ID=CAMNT_0039161017 /DNA_START=44 /DNA_END=1654 /DNA_ORIENTATION=+